MSFLQRAFRRLPCLFGTSARTILNRMVALPHADLDAITGGRATLVLAPHPDDESLGCGGLIAEACARGRPPVVAVLTDGTMSHPNSPSYPAPRLKALREEEARAAVECLGLGADRLHFLGLRDTAVPGEGAAFQDTVARLVGLIRQHDLGSILVTWEHDPHADHVAAHRIAAAVARMAGVRLIAYPVWGWTLPANRCLPGGPTTGARLDIARHLPAKRRAIAAHASQHSALIADDPQAFRLAPEMLAIHDRPFEVFLFPANGPTVDERTA